MAANLEKAHSLKAVQRVFILTLGLNLLVSFSKLVWGYHTNTLSLTADGFHSLLDAVSNVVGIVSLNYSMKPPDYEHPYGHRKFEAIASLIISFFIFLTCFEVASSGFERLFSPQASKPDISLTSYLVIGFTLLVNIAVSRYETRRGMQLRNELLLTDARHTLSDCMVSVAVLFSMVAIQAGYLWVDIVSAFVVAIIILKVGFDLILAHLSTLTDEAVLAPDAIQQLVLQVPGVLGCHKIRSRGLPDHIFIDLHIQVDPQLTVKEAHGISYAVEETLENAFDGRVSEVLVHIEEHEECLP